MSSFLKLGSIYHAIYGWAHLSGGVAAASGVGRRSCIDAAHGRAASGVPLRWRAHAAGAAGCRGEQGGPASCENTDAADGDGNGLSQAEYLQASARPQDLSVSAAWPCDRLAEPGVGDGHHL